MSESVAKVVIVGGGPAGLAAAIHLRRYSNIDVTIVEARCIARPRVGETVPPDFLLLLDQLQLTAQFRAGGHLPCPGNVSLWGNSTPGYNDFLFNPRGPAWHLDRVGFEAMLAEKAAAVGADLLTDTRFVRAQPRSDGFEVTLHRVSDGYLRLTANWLIDATGWSARVARGLGSRWLSHDRLVAIVRFGTANLANFPPQTLLESAEVGWWYAARLPRNRIVTMLATDYENATQMMANEGAMWREALSKTELMGRSSLVRQADETFHSVPIVSSILDIVEGDRWMAIGDAASCYDPLSSQGIHKALTDAYEAANVIASRIGLEAPLNADFSRSVQSRFRTYLANRNHFYRLERRWQSSPFWMNRCSRQNSLANQDDPP